MEMKTETWNGHKIRFVEKESGEWWAVAKDVSETLEYIKASDMTRIIDDSDKGVHKVRTLGGEQELLIVSECGICEAIFSSRKPEAKEFKRWVYELLKTLRQSIELESFQILRMLDREHQKEAMQRLCSGLNEPSKVNYIKANTIANKAISTRYGYSKMIKKEKMPSDWLPERQSILDDTVNLMTINDKFSLGISVSEAIYSKHCNQA